MQPEDVDCEDKSEEIFLQELEKVKREFDAREPRYAKLIKIIHNQCAVRCPLCYKKHFHGLSVSGSFVPGHRVRHCLPEDVHENFKEYSGYRLVEKLPDNLVESEYYSDPRRNFVLYRHYDRYQRLLYVGVTNNIFSRLGQHKNSDFFSELINGGFTKYERFHSREELLEAEKDAIEEESPMFNVVHNR